MESSQKIIYITLLCTVYCFAWSTQDKINVSIPTPIVLELKQLAEKCGQENGVPASHLKKIIDKTLPNDDANNNFFFCTVTGSGFTDKDGHFLAKLETLQVVDGKQEDYVNTIKECNKIVKDNPVQTLLATADCVHQNYHFAPAVAKQ